ncbi:hypothetical protein I302_103273 [Kwoniella bestiolae CBS 10118]|uniref:Uncharacterized protein n=1 Tax=Kwoniella bestiolae CBS 10118 TaxID=1296100 RepID=A0A1B9G7X5_9TREE|nr:hypothetical protein I302_01972 [Kwoniella bestiolae CBS 10118]OCF27137.1 hypothetical protein I302_01972 [Kwoniella bestiolae CBS 10118]
MSSRRGQTSSNQTGGSSNSSGTFCDPETERKYLSKISSGHQELSDFICGKRPNPPAPSDIAPFYMGGAAGCRHDLDLVSGSWSIAKILYERSKLRSKSLLPQQLSPKARDEVGNIRRQLFLGSQTDAELHAINGKFSFEPVIHKSEHHLLSPLGKPRRLAKEDEL